MPGESKKEERLGKETLLPVGTWIISSTAICTGKCFSLSDSEKAHRGNKKEAARSSIDAFPKLFSHRCFTRLLTTCLALKPMGDISGSTKSGVLTDDRGLPAIS